MKMGKIGKSILFLILMTSLGAQAETVKIAPLLKYDVEKIVSTNRFDKACVLFVNVAGALQMSQLCDAACAVWSDSHVNVGVVSVDSLGTLSPFQKGEYRDARLSEKGKVIVYVINDKEKASFISSPGKWAVVNVYGFDRQLPKGDSERYARRLRQLMLKGFGMSLGLGYTDDARCVMYYKTFTPETIDQTTLGFTFTANSVALNLLSERFGENIFSVPE
jgi:hypothetical protein